VGDENQRETVFLLDLLEQPDDRPLHQQIQRRRRLVHDQHVGFEDETQRDQCTLFHATRQFVRIRFENEFRVEVQVSEQFPGVVEAGIDVRVVSA